MTVDDGMRCTHIGPHGFSAAAPDREDTQVSGLVKIRNQQGRQQAPGYWPMSA